MYSYDLLGNIAIIKAESLNKQEKLKKAKKILENPKIKTVLEKITNVQGRLRTIKTEHLLGEKTLIAKYKENNSIFKFNVETCYFSSRLSGERKKIAKKIKKKNTVLVMFAGVGVYPIVIYKYIKPKKITAIEIGKDCCKYFKENLKLNKIPKSKIEIIQGDVKKKITSDFEKFDVVIMARPNLKQSFLKQGLKACKRNSKLFYYGFCNANEIRALTKDLINQAEELSRKIKLIEIIKAGDIAPYKFRYRIEFKVLK